MKTVVGWVRTGKKCEMERQREMIEAYCVANDMRIAEWKEGDEFDSVAYGNWMGHRKIDAVVVARNGDVTESGIEYYAFRCKMRMRSSDLVVAEWREYPGLGLHRKLIETFTDVMVGKEMANEPILRKNGRIRKAARGGYIGGQAPMGYRVEDGKLVVNPEEVPVVLFIMKEKHRGGTKTGTVEKLNANGYKTRRGGPFQISTVQSIWNNEELYRGYRRAGDEWVKGQHEAILK